MRALGSRLIASLVQALDLAICLGVGRLSKAMLHALSAADAVKTVPAWQELLRLGRELHPIIGQHRI